MGNKLEYSHDPGCIHSVRFVIILLYLLKCLYSKINTSRPHFFLRIIFTGYKRPLEDQDLWALRRTNQASYIVPRLRQKWIEKQRKCTQL